MATPCCTPMVLSVALQTTVGGGLKEARSRGDPRFSFRAKTQRAPFVANKPSALTHMQGRDQGGADHKGSGVSSKV
jgi:hypothetical protein